MHSIDMGAASHRAPGAQQRAIIVTIALCFAGFLAWTAFFQLDEVAVGPGRIIPSSQTQLVQSVQGGRVIELNVDKGDLVKEGELLAILDTTKIRAEIDESEAGLLDGLAQQQVLRTLLTGGTHLTWSDDQSFPPELKDQKTALFNEMLWTQENAISDLENEQQLLVQEMDIFKRASALGGGTEIERLRLQQKIAATITKLNGRKKSFTKDLQIQLDEVNRTVQQIRIRMVAQQELLSGNELRSPRAGIVQDILVSTAGGGVLAPNGTVMEIVPIEDRLLIEARFSPRDIAFIAPNQTARIKVTAYDYSIYGDLEGKVLRVSPDSFQDEMNNGEYYFAVTLEADTTYFETADGTQFPIIPGMVTTTEIQTGARTILQYLLKPLRKASEALRER
jgi:adhesin transport system membrane fusion protein